MKLGERNKFRQETLSWLLFRPSSCNVQQACLNAKYLRDRAQIRCFYKLLMNQTNSFCNTIKILSKKGIRVMIREKKDWCNIVIVSYVGDTAEMKPLLSLRHGILAVHCCPICLLGKSSILLPNIKQKIILDHVEFLTLYGKSAWSRTRKEWDNFFPHFLLHYYANFLLSYLLMKMTSRQSSFSKWCTLFFLEPRGIWITVNSKDLAILDTNLI